MSLDEVLTRIVELYPHYDKTAVELSLATVLSSRTESNSPIWMFVIGVPSSGKSRMRIWFSKLKMDGRLLSYEVDSFTEASIKFWAPDANNMCVLIGDAMRTLESEAESLATLRLFYEGKVVTEMARVADDVRTVFTNFAVLAFTTHFIDAYFEAEMKLGAVFLKYRIPPKTDEEQLEAILTRRPTPKDDLLITQMLQKYVDSLDVETLPAVKNSFLRELGGIAHAVEQMRQILKMEQKFGGVGEIVAVRPHANEIFRLQNQADLLARILAWMRGKEEVTNQEVQVVAKAMIGTVPDIRHAILRSMYEDDGEWVAKDGMWDYYARKIRLTEKSLKYHLSTLHEMGLVDLTEDGSPLDERGDGKTLFAQGDTYRLSPEVSSAWEILDRLAPKAREEETRPIGVQGVNERLLEMWSGQTMEEYLARTTPGSPVDEMMEGIGEAADQREVERYDEALKQREEEVNVEYDEQGIPRLKPKEKGKGQN